MKFSFETVYDQKALTVMAKAVRKTVRKKRINGGSVKKFRDFIEEKTGIKIKDI